MGSIRFAMLVLAMGMFLLGCTQPSSTSTRNEVNPGEEFTLKANETAYIQSESLRVFIANIEDSRCPSDVLCVVAGQANVNVGLAKEGDGTQIKELVYSVDGPSSALVAFPQAGTSFLVYNVTVLDVIPYPRTTDPLTLSNYTVTLRIDRA